MVNQRYPIYRVKKISRRYLLTDAGSALLLEEVAAVGDKRHKESSHDTRSLRPEKEQIEHYNELSDSGYFFEDVRRFKEEVEEDVSFVDEKIDLMRIIQDNFTLPNIDRPILRANLEALAPAMGYVESWYENSLSEIGAFGVMQLMPGTWEEFAQDDEDKNDVAVQVKVAARLKEQAYQRIARSCAAELAQIENTFFGGDAEAFETTFLTPILINSYNIDISSMENLIKEFIKMCPEPDETVGLFDQSETLTGYDVFIGMAHTGNLRGWADWYKDIATNYTCKVYGAHEALGEYFEKIEEANKKQKVFLNVTPV